nr:AI-2E family transporter [uncultured Cohaesibacter sp.]
MSRMRSQNPYDPRVEFILKRCAFISLIFMAIVLLIVVLHLAKAILSPLFLAVIVGLVLGPMADRIESIGIPAWLSAMLMVAFFLTAIAIALVGFAVPLSEWLDRLPQIWLRLQAELADWKGFLASVTSLQEQLNAMTGAAVSDVTVNVSETNTVAQVAFLAPSLAAQIILFLACLFFFIATRNGLRRTILAQLKKGRRRIKLARVLVKIEKQISSYMLHITLINITLAFVVSGALWVMDVPSPILWGLLAGVLNFVIYIGPAIMTFIMLAVGLAVSTDFSGIVTPAATYLFINFLEAQFLTPMVLGRVMTLNPFVIFFSLVFWIWLWGPVGGFIAVPILMMITLFVQNAELSSVGPARQGPAVPKPS